MRTVNIHEAKTHLSRLAEDAANGAEIVIAKAGRPVARLVAFERKRAKRRLGALRGKLTASRTFDTPLPEDLLALFES